MNARLIPQLGAVLLATFAALAPRAGWAQQLPTWVDRGADWAKTKATLQAFGDQFASSEAMYDALRTAAKGGKALTWSQIGRQQGLDWSGIFTRGAGGLQYDPDVPSRPGPPKSPEPPYNTARLTAAGAAVVRDKAAAMFASGGQEFDTISNCSPPGTPRWFSEPFLKEYIITPGTTWLINEMANDVRRIYTDGRPHTTEVDAYPTPNGDSIGFWNGDVLTAHTKYLKSGQYQRGILPNFSDQTSVVERWHKSGPGTLEVDTWVFDPVNLAKPWYTRQTYTKLANDNYSLRIRYWDCGENPNNAVIRTDEGGSQFKGFTFAPKAPDSK